MWVPRWHSWPNGPFTLNQASPQALGLLAWWPTTERRTGHIYELAAQQTGELNGVIPVVSDPVFGPASDFSANTDNYFEIDKTPRLSFTGSFSVSAWVKTGALALGSEYHIIGSGLGWNWSNTNWLLCKPQWAWQMDFIVGDSTTNFNVVDCSDVGMPSFDPDSWYHFIGIFDKEDESLRLWMNGKRSLDWDYAGIGNVNQSDTVIHIGRRTDGNYPWLGSIGDIRIYDHALKDAEAWALYEPSTRWELYQPLYRLWVVKATVASGAIAATNAATAAQTAALKGAGALAGTNAATAAQTAALLGAGALAANSPAATTQTGNLLGAGSLAASSPSTTTQTANLTGWGALAVINPATTTQTGTLLGAGALAAISAAVTTQTADLQGAGPGTGPITANCPATTTTLAVLYGTGTLNGIAIAQGGSTATLSGSGFGFMASVIQGTGNAFATLTGFGINPPILLSGGGGSDYYRSDYKVPYNKKVIDDAWNALILAEDEELLLIL